MIGLNWQWRNCVKCNYHIISYLYSIQYREIGNDCYSLVNCLFEIMQPTINASEEKVKHVTNIKYFNSSLNNSQKEAIMFCLQCNEVGLIHGPPGTGKTTTVVELILQLVSMGNKLLVVTPSNIAVDNIAEKLLQYTSHLKFELVRHGHPARLLPSVIDSCLDAKIEASTDMKFIREVKLEIEKNKRELDKTSHKDKEKKRRLKDELKDLRNEMKGNYIEKINSIFQSANVILATCVGSGEKKLQYSITQPFDYVIIDECAQGTECLCWISILQGKKLILAGDHLQLPPTIKSKEAEYILGYTLFDRLMDMYGQDVSRMLTIQYRMHELIMNFSSKELYDGKLSAHDSVKNHKLIDLMLSNDWISKDAISEKDTLNIVNKNLVLVDTAGLQFYETLDLETLSRFNIGEVEICKVMIDYLAALSIPLINVGIITPYSAQVNTLKDHLGSDEYKELEISTVDGFQGREKEIIILSLVRSNKTSEVGFLADKRRLNVAITRPKRLLVVIGDTSTIESDSFLKKLSEYLISNATLIEVIGNIMNHETFKEVQAMCVDEKQKEVKDGNSKKGKGGYEEEKEDKVIQDSHNTNKGKYDGKKSNNKKHSNTKNKPKKKK